MMRIGGESRHQNVQNTVQVDGIGHAGLLDVAPDSSYGALKSGSQPLRHRHGGPRLRGRRGSAADPLNLIQVMLA